MSIFIRYDAVFYESVGIQMSFLNSVNKIRTQDQKAVIIPQTLLSI